VPAPRVEIGRVRLHVLVGRVPAVRVKDELVRREEVVAVHALDALGARAVVTRREEGPAAAPGALVMNSERKVLGQPAEATSRHRVIDHDFVPLIIGTKVCVHISFRIEMSSRFVRKDFTVLFNNIYRVVLFDK